MGFTTNFFLPILHLWGILSVSALSSGRPLGKRIAQNFQKSSKLQQTNRNLFTIKKIWSRFSGQPLPTPSVIAKVSSPPLQTFNVGIFLWTEAHPPRLWPVLYLHCWTALSIMESLISISCWLLIITACMWCLIYDISSPKNRKNNNKSVGQRTAGPMWAKSSGCMPHVRPR